MPSFCNPLVNALQKSPESNANLNVIEQNYGEPIVGLMAINNITGIYGVSKKQAQLIYLSIVKFLNLLTFWFSKLINNIV